MSGEQGMPSYKHTVPLLIILLSIIFLFKSRISGSFLEVPLRIKNLSQGILRAIEIFSFNSLNVFLLSMLI